MDGKTVSQEQLTANRVNAQKSTGPRTAEGKRRSSRNSLKHGILAQDLVITVGDGKEDVAAFEELRDRLYEDLKPRDVLEEIAVNDVLQSVWRQRRCLRAEQGEIRLRVDRVAERMRQARSDEATSIVSPGGEVYAGSELRRKSYGVGQYIVHVLSTRWWVEARGCLTEDEVKTLIEPFGNDDRDIQDEIRRLAGLASKACRAERKKPGCPEAEEAAARKQELLAQFDKWLARLEEQKRSLAEREEFEIEAELASRALPSAEVLERISRYETTSVRRREKAVETLLKLKDRDLGGGPDEEEASGESEA